MKKVNINWNSIILVSFVVSLVVAVSINILFNGFHS